MLIKYIKSVLWRVAKCLSYIEEVRCLKVKLQKPEMYKMSVINMGTKVYNKLPTYLKGIDNHKAFKKELKLFLLL